MGEVNCTVTWFDGHGGFGAYESGSLRLMPIYLLIVSAFSKVIVSQLLGALLTLLKSCCKRRKPDYARLFRPNPYILGIQTLAAVVQFFYVLVITGRIKSLSGWNVYELMFARILNSGITSTCLSIAVQSHFALAGSNLLINQPKQEAEAEQVEVHTTSTAVVVKEAPIQQDTVQKEGEVNDTKPISDGGVTNAIQTLEQKENGQRDIQAQDASAPKPVEENATTQEDNQTPIEQNVEANPNANAQEDNAPAVEQNVEATPVGEAHEEDTKPEQNLEATPNAGVQEGGTNPVVETEKKQESAGSKDDYNMTCAVISLSVSNILLMLVLVCPFWTHIIPSLLIFCPITLAFIVMFLIVVAAMVFTAMLIKPKGEFGTVFIILPFTSTITALIVLFLQMMFNYGVLFYSKNYSWAGTIQAEFLGRNTVCIFQDNVNKYSLTLEQLWNRLSYLW